MAQQSHITTYSISVEIDGHLPAGLYDQNFESIEKDGIYLTPHCRIGRTGAAMLDSWELAEKWAQACMPVLERRYKGTVRYGIEEQRVRLTPVLGEKRRALVSQHSAIVRERLRIGNFRPNRAPRLLL